MSVPVRRLRSRLSFLPSQVTRREAAKKALHGSSRVPTPLPRPFSACDSVDFIGGTCARPASIGSRERDACYTVTSNLFFHLPPDA